VEADMEFDEQELQRLYTSQYRVQYLHLGTVRLVWATFQMDDEQAALNAASLREALLGGADMAEAAETFGAEAAEMAFNLNRIRGQTQSVPILDAAFSLPQGEVSNVVAEPDAGLYWVFRCLEREGESTLSFEDTRSIITYDLSEAEYKRMLAERAGSELKIDSGVYDRITESDAKR